MLSLFVCMHALLIITGYWCMFYTMISFFYVFQFGVMLDVYNILFFCSHRFIYFAAFIHFDG